MQLFIIILVAFFIYCIQARLYYKLWNKNLTVSIAYSQSEAQIGDTVELLEVVRNEKLLPLPALSVKFSSSKTFIYEDMDASAISDRYYRNDIFSILGYQEITRSQKFTVTQRGYYSIPSLDMVSKDLFMRASHATMVPNHTTLYVYPRILQNKSNIQYLHSMLGELSQNNYLEDPLSFRSIRDYSSTDSMRYINWKATAKTGEFMVNTFYDNQSAQITLMLNLDSHITQRSTHLYEYTISVAATVMEQITKQGLPYRIAINTTEAISENVIVTNYGKGYEHFLACLKILSRLDPLRDNTDFLEFFEGSNCIFQPGTNEMYIILSNYRKPLIQQAYSLKQQQGYHMHFICPEYPDQITGENFVHYWEVNYEKL